MSLRPQPKDIDLFEVKRLGAYAELFDVGASQHTPSLTYWVGPERGVAAIFLFDSKATLKLALFCARQVARGGTVLLNHDHGASETLDASWFEANLLHLVDFRGATAGNGR